MHQNIEAVERDIAVGEVLEALMQSFDSAVMVQVLRVDIGDDRDSRGAA